MAVLRVEPCYCGLKRLFVVGLVFAATGNVLADEASDAARETASQGSTNARAAVSTKTGDKPAASPKPATKVKKPPVIAPSAVSSMSRAPTSEESATLEEERKKDIEIYIRRTQDFKEVVDGMVRRVYKMRLKHVQDSYEASLRAEEELKAKSLEDAIAFSGGLHCIELEGSLLNRTGDDSEAVLPVTPACSGAERRVG